MSELYTFTDETLLEDLPDEIAASNSWQVYATVKIAGYIDKLAGSAPDCVEYKGNKKQPDWFYIIASSKGAPGSVKVRRSKSKSTATFSIRLPMESLKIARPGRGRKERFAVEFVEKSEFGVPALKVYTRALENDPVANRNRVG